MKQIIKLFTLIFAMLTVLLMLLLNMAATDGIAIDENNFPDANFRAYVQTLDTDNNNTLSTYERDAVKKIFVVGKHIADLTGVEYFTNLEQLFCSQNALETIDVRANTKLQVLNVNLNTRLAQLDVSANTKLYWLGCVKTGINSLDVSNNTALTYLACGDTQLTTLDISQNGLLEELEIDSTLIQTIDLSRNPSLNRLSFSNTNFTSLDLSAQKGSVSMRSGEVYYSCSFATGTISLSELPGSFDANKTSNWVNATRTGDLLTIDAGVTEVTYDYDCGNGQTVTFKLISDTKAPVPGGDIDDSFEGIDNVWENPYSDIADDHPNLDAIQHVTKRNVFQGTDKNNPTFSPSMKLTRAQIVTIFGRLAGVDVTKYTTSSFTDVDPTKSSHAWFAPYVEWASEQGLVLGYGNGKFGPNDDLTIEQTIVFLARYARLDGKSTDSDASLEIYQDASDVSKWAQADMKWAAASGIYRGQEGKLVPKSVTNRLLTAIFIYLYDTLL